MFEKRTNLYILTGFLGAGKTTVLMRILEQLKDDSVGIIQSDFELQGMDGLKMESVSKAGILEMVEVSNGSIFCSCRQDSFVEALVKMGTYNLKNLFLESYGLTDPAGIREVLVDVQHEIGEIYNLKGIICLIDAKNFIEQARSVETVHRQLKHCHLAVINKADLVSPELLTALISQVRRINSLCEVLICSYGHFNLDFMGNNLLTHDWYEHDGLFEPSEAPQPLFLNCDGPLEKEKLLEFLELIKENTYRIKGFMELTNGWHQIDVVGSKVECRPCKAHHDSKLVFISKLGTAVTNPIHIAWENTVGIHMDLVD